MSGERSRRDGEGETDCPERHRRIAIDLGQLRHRAFRSRRIGQTLSNLGRMIGVAARAGLRFSVGSGGRLCTAGRVAAALLLAGLRRYDPGRPLA